MLFSRAGANRGVANRGAIGLPEAAARRVLLVQAFETGPADNPQWTLEDRAWATRMARETVAAGAPPAQFLVERARHALQRLAPRDAGVVRALAERRWRPGWLLAALLIGMLVGVAVDAIGSGQRINLLAPPVWGVIVWNVLVYIGLLVAVFVPVFVPVFATGASRARAWLAQGLVGRVAAGTPMARFHAAWLRTAAPLLGARAALLCHTAAAALALGLVAGLYVRGLVLDYRVGWQSTFLDASQVQAALALLLSPASALTGIAVPDAATLQALRVGPEALTTAITVGKVISMGDSTGDSTRAAPWIHLYAAMLALFVVLPRALLAAGSATIAWQRARRLPLLPGDLYLDRLLRERQAQTAHVQVLAHGAAPSAHALACLQTVLAAALGAGVQVRAATATAYGDEDAAAALAAPPATTLRLALVDLAATPEDDSHGAFVRALRRAAAGGPLVPLVPLVVLADETAFRARFASLPARLNERRAAWRSWAQAQGVGLVCIDLAQPDGAAAARDLQIALLA